MKFVSALILVCVFAFASAQYAVKGGSESGARSGLFYPQFRPNSGLKTRLQSPNVYSGPSVFADGSTDLVAGRGGFSGQLDGQYGQWVRPSYYTSNSGYGPGAFSPVSVGKVGTMSSRRQYTAPQAFISQPAPLQAPQQYTSYTPSSYSYLSYPQLSSSSLASVPTTQTVPSYTRQYTSVPSVSTGLYNPTSVPATTTADVSPIGSGQIFTDNKISSPGFSLESPTVLRQEKQYAAPQAIVSRPALIQTPPSYASYTPASYSYSSYPQVSSPRLASVPTTQTVPSFTRQYTSVPSVSTGLYNPTSVPAITTADVSPIGSGQIFTDNKISTAGFSLESPTMLRQEKQFAVQPTLVSRPAPLQTLQSYSSNSPSSYSYLSYPQLSSSRLASVPTTTTRTVPSVSTGFYSTPAISSATLPVSSFPAVTTAAADISPIGSGQIFTDNKISSAGFSLQSPAMLSQEKQFADTVQTTEW